jgi:hypothetical protein
MRVRRLSEKEIRKTYALIERYYQQYLRSRGVKLPQLKCGERFTVDALALVYLAQGYPHTRWVTKEELTEFVRLYRPNTNDVQSGRHLGMQKGFYIASSRRGNYLPQGKPPPDRDAYLLVTLEQPHPAFQPKRRLKAGGGGSPVGCAVRMSFIKKRPRHELPTLAVRYARVRQGGGRTPSMREYRPFPATGSSATGLSPTSRGTASRFYFTS